ncbi:histidinol-phosphate aminotransferase [Amycolatopsis tolypomycina]|uniref:Histidinol-phosphate aminotransferase n=1 Tax=Amycolatopsis tolypomycina TaxID=208445 RepID=A0A1H4ZSR0_9PSEU|nr:aminotransferase class I/II-fold pyridoxal phosphate-dependent enzyme [Amycolatopsis tolypomycina]SED33236.1 histidinol-phosphate aminotransferase [Amycolatopsis tolypomycina]
MDTERLRAALGGPADGFVRLSMNENRREPLPGVESAVVEATRDPGRGPDPWCSALSAALARRLSVDVENVLVGAGSSALLHALCQTSPGDVVHPWPSFEMYPLMAGAKAVAAPPDLDALGAAVTSRTALVILCNPNNPTGDRWRAGEVEQFLAGLPAHVTVVLDEAYREFAEDCADGVELFRRDPRVCVVRTFSKAYGLFGLRVGYAVAEPELAGRLRMALLPFLVPATGQAAALAALQAEDAMRQSVARIREDRDALRAALLDLGWSVPRSHASFLWVPGAGERLAGFLAERGILVRDVAGLGVRISVGTPEENRKLVEAAAEFPA